MKNLITFFKLLLFPLFFILFTTSSYAVELANEQFSSSANGYTDVENSSVYWVADNPYGDSDGYMLHGRNDWGEIEYNFGSSYVNQTLNVEMRWCTSDNWEDHEDYLRVRVNGTTVETDYFEGECHTINFTADADSSGDFTIQIDPRTDNDNEEAYIDWFTINGTPIPSFCTATNGLSADYYNNDSFTAPIGVSRIDSDINFEWGSGGPGGGINSNYFSTEWTGTIYFPEDADYIFSLAHDDTMELIIDGTTVYNGTSWTGGTNNFVDATSTYFAAGTYPITIRFVEWTGGAYAKLAWRNNANIGSQTIVASTYLCSVPPTPAPPTMGDIPDQSGLIGTPFTLSVASYVTEPNGDTITYSAAGLPPGLVIDSATGVISGTPTTAGTYTVTATATDVDGSDSDDFVITVLITPIVATDDTYTTTPGASISGNFISDDTGNGADTGVNLVATTTPVSGPSNGTVIISADGSFTYTPSSSAVVTDSFTYTITDDYSQTATATVTINAEVQETSGGELPFYLINPDNTRNIIGNYAIAGNTVLCLTTLTDSFADSDDICQGDNNYEDITSNMRIAKYLDIDGDSSTWNSTSSNITLPDSYDPSVGVLWAGLFWGGRISADSDHPIRYYVENGSSYDEVQTGEGTSVGTSDIDLMAAEANRIKLKVNNGAYNDASAATFHVYESGGGKTYAAYADVTPYLSGLDTNGTHTFTVANLTTMEGREPSPGAFGGWSLIVIYQEDFNLGKPRNISIYNGFVSIDENNDPITISGFKLPKTGDVDAQLAVFSGEGEHRYGRTTSSNNEDWMKISDDISSGYDYMPGLTAGTHLGNRDNSFNAQLVGIDRDSVVDASNNNMFNDLGVNNVGVDIDFFDVSTLMATYRDSNQDINEIFITTFSDNDYITTSMIAYSAELYIPELCYDYTLDIDGYVLDSVDNHISTPFGAFGYPLRTQIFFRSLEGDIDLQDFNVTYNIIDTSQLTYQDCSTEISELGAYDYVSGCPYTVDVAPSGFTMYLGTGKTSTSGGTISANESRYLSWKSDFQTALVNTDFTFEADYTVNYGSGAVPLHKQFTSADLCPPDNNITGGYLPDLGTFNVVDGGASYDEYNLYTQVARRPFNLTLYAYDATDLTSLVSDDLNFSVEIEMIRADNFSRDAQTACDDQYSILSDVDPQFTHFDGGTSAPISYGADDVNISYRSAAMRVWYLTDVNGSGIVVDDHNCTRPNQSACIDLYNDKYASDDTQCSAICNVSAAWDPVFNNCYGCLRTNYGRKVCSRDNFAIRPESFVTQIFDSNQSVSIDDPSNLIAYSVTSAPAFSVVAGYNYRFDVNATNHANDMATNRYIQHFSPGDDSTHWVKMRWFPGSNVVTGCNDVDDKNISINIFNGSTVNNYTRESFLDKVDQIGQYRFEIFDSNWTAADWDTNQMQHHTQSPYAGFFNGGTDCATGSSTVPSSASSATVGCDISSVHTNVDTGTSYVFLDAVYYPYTFNTDGLIFSNGPSGASNFVYINDPGENDKNMSYNVQGTFYAAGYTDENVTNFVDNCYADDVNMSLYQEFLHPTPDTSNDHITTPTPFLTYDLIDYNITNPADVIRARHQNTFTFANDDSTARPLLPLVIVQQAQWFRQDMQGAITMDLGYNFDRSFNVALNPRLMQMNDFNITYTVSPPNVNVDLQVDYQIFGNRGLDQNVSFFYGRAKPGQFFYEDIIDLAVNTPVSILAYCNLGFTECQNRGIQSAFAQTNELDWWLSLDHRTTNDDGDIVLDIGAITEGGGNPTVTPGSPNALSIIADATDNTVTVARGANPTLPMTVNIDLDTNSTLADFTDTWVIFNEDADAVPSPFYRVRFIGQSGWAGHGDVGFVVDDNASIRKNRRLGW